MQGQRPDHVRHVFAQAIILLTMTAGSTSTDTFLSSWQLALDDDQRTGFVAEAFGSLQVLSCSAVTT